MSNDKDVVIESINTAQSDYNETTGLINWNLSPKAGETQKLSMGYTVKYPRGTNVAGLR